MPVSFLINYLSIVSFLHIFFSRKSIKLKVFFKKKKQFFHFQEAYTKYGNEGKSCIAFAIAELEELGLIESLGSWDGLNRLDLCFLGMAAMYDPPRDTALKSLQTMKNAGLI